ncbi:MAG: ABC transporter substrate-binding protein [Pseudomonadota bacterium]
MKPLEKLTSQLTAGKIGRRQFMEGALALGATALAAEGLMSQALAADPKQGGRLRLGIGHGSTTDSLDPSTHENGYMQNVAYTYANNLTEVDETGNLVPELAESWDASDDARTWTFKLRPGVEFHNGKTVTSDDVITSMNHHRGTDSKSSATALLEQVADIRADGDGTVVFELETGNADWPFIVSDYHLLILPAKDGKMDWQAKAGTGAYKIESYDPGVRSFFTKNPNYFKEGRGHFDEVETIAIIDPAARQNAVTTGEVDVIDRVDLKTAHLLDRVPSVGILETTGTLHYTFPMRTDTAPFDNNDVRMALKLAVDREELLKKILRGRGSLGNDHPISVANRYHNGDLPQRSYDPEKAKWHLKQAGAEGLTVDLSSADAAFNGAVDAAVLYKEHAAKAGITINVVREPNDGYWSNVWNKKPWCACYWGGRPTEDWMFSAAYSNDAKWNDTVFRNDKFNDLLIEARAELNDDKRRELYGEMQQILSDEGGTLCPMFANHVHAVSTKVGHGENVAGNWQLDGNKCGERWWFS